MAYYDVQIDPVLQGPVVQKVDNAIHWIVQLAPVIRIRWIVIYPVDSAIQRLNNPGQEINGEVLTPCTNSSSRCSARHSLSFRSGKALPFLTLGFDAQMQSLIKA